MKLSFVVAIVLGITFSLFISLPIGYGNSESIIEIISNKN